jgi:ribosomal protein L37E
MSDPKQSYGRMEAVDPVIFDAVTKGLIRVDVARVPPDGRAVFHLHRKTEVLCRKCGHLSEDTLINRCPMCGADANKSLNVLQNKPLYSGEWGRKLESRLVPVLESVFNDGELEWIPELDSWYFTPKHDPMDSLKAAEMVLERLALA